MTKFGSAIIRGNRTYSHQSCLDLDMFVYKVVYQNPEYFKLKVGFVDRKSGYVFQQTGTVKLYRKHLQNWTQV